MVASTFISDTFEYIRDPESDDCKYELHFQNFNYTHQIDLLIEQLSVGQRNRLYDLVSENEGCWAYGSLQPLELIHKLIESPGVDINGSQSYPRRVVEWFGQGKLALTELKYLISKGYQVPYNLINWTEHADDYPDPDEDDESFENNKREFMELLSVNNDN